MMDLEESVRLAKEHLARIDADLWKLRDAHREEILRERAVHEDRLRNIGERFFLRERAEKAREALIKTLVDVESLKAPQPRLIVGVPFECDPKLPDDVMEARHADGRVERFKIES